MTDHYEVLGVGPDAGREEIRDAYRTRKEALADDDSDDARAEVASLNQAWSVLADPYQRGRYDEQRAQRLEREADDDAEEDDEDAAAAPRRRGLFERPEPAKGGKGSGKGGKGGKGGKTPVAEPTIPIPPGAVLAETKPRVYAMLFDLAVLLVLFVVAQFLLVQMIQSRYPDTVDRIDRLADEVADAHDLASLAGDCAGDTATCEQTATERADAQTAAAQDYREIAALGARGRAAVQQAVDDLGDNADADHENRLKGCLDDVERCPNDAQQRADFADSVASDYHDLAAAAKDGDTATIDDLQTRFETQRDALTKQRDDEYQTYRGLSVVVFIAYFVVGLAYLVPMSALTGQTPGKRLRGVRVIRVDGSPLGWSAALVRYGLLVAFMALFLIVLVPLAQIGFVLALVGVLTWMRNPNRQGLHDRVAKTLVVEA